jgi:hypothetical protein
MSFYKIYSIIPSFQQYSQCKENLADWSIIYLFKGGSILPYSRIGGKVFSMVVVREVSIDALLICLDIIGRR